jgi:hypothetical protein
LVLGFGVKKTTKKSGKRYTFTGMSSVEGFAGSTPMSECRAAQFFLRGFSNTDHFTKIQRERNSRSVRLKITATPCCAWRRGTQPSSVTEPALRTMPLSDVAGTSDLFSAPEAVAMIHDSAPEVKLVLCEDQGIGRVAVEIEPFFEFSFWLAEELQDLEAANRQYILPDSPTSSRFSR